MIRFVSAKVDPFPILRVEYSDGERRRYDLTQLFAGYPPAEALLSDPVAASKVRRTNRGGMLTWNNDVDISVLNLRYWKDDLDRHEWAGLAPEVPYAERLVIAEANLARQRPDKVEIDLRHEITPAEYARRKQLSIQTVQKQIERGTLKVRRIPELGLTLVQVA